MYWGSGGRGQEDEESGGAGRKDDGSAHWKIATLYKEAVVLAE